MLILLILSFFISTIIPSLANLISNEKTLKNLAAPNTKIGSIVNYQTLFPESGESEQKYRKLYKQELNAVTIANPLKDMWQSSQKYNLLHFNAVVNWFEQQDFVQIAHLPIRPNHYLPEWLIENSYTDQELENIIENTIRTIMQSNNNQNKVDIWMVINEAFWLKGGTPYAGTIWNQFGREEDKSGLTGNNKVLARHPIYIRKALEIARKYTNSKLAILDNGIEFPNNDEYQMFYQLARHLVNTKVPLDAVGFQTHLNVDETYDWEGLKNNIRRYKELGLEVYIAELDIGNDGTENGRTKQKEYYYNAVKAMREGGADIINLWGLNDGQMGDYREDEYALIFEDANITPKPAYFGIQKALKNSRK
jgi:GH35 family endo-1,4-beta-xylanase